MQSGWQNFDTREVSFTWDRALKSVRWNWFYSRTAEPVSYTIHTLKQEPGRTEYTGAVVVHGERYTQRLLPGTYSYMIQGRWNTSEAPFTHKGWTTIVVR